MGRPDRDPAPTEGDYWSRARVHAFSRLAATFGGIYICSLLWAPFLSTFTWAVTLAILFAPAHKAIEERLKSPNLAAAASVAVTRWAGCRPARKSQALRLHGLLFARIVVLNLARG